MMNTIIDSDSTITAISTPAGPGGIGIIKISGNDALKIAQSIFKRSVTRNGVSGNAVKGNEPPFESHKLLLGKIVDPDNGRIIDEVLLTYMKAPKSYTMEDVVEINAHSGPAVLRSILELVLEKGARIAEPGEFTKRAFLNGRVDLTQAEAVADIIQSKTEKSLEVAVSQVSGVLGDRIKEIRTTLQEILVNLEAAIDFPEDMDDAVDNDISIKLVDEKVISKIDELIKHYNSGSIIREGLKVSIVGKPNVGKSSLMNCLLKKERAIVTSIPGTTRDVIEESIDIGGIPVSLSDTAGLHETEDPVEAIGVDKAWDTIHNADMILFMIDASVDVDSDDIKIYKQIREKKIILVVNKSDLVDEGFFPEIPDNWEELLNVKISALYERGIDRLKELIEKISFDQEDVAESGMIPNMRQKCALEKSHKAAVAAVEGLKKGLSAELISIDIKEAMDGLGEILGMNAGPDILGEIFSRFCIGK